MRNVTCPFILIAALSGCDLPGKPDPAQKFVAPTEVKDFAVLFGNNCAGCHGKEGRLGPGPPLNDPVFLTIVPDGVLLQVITAGRQGTEMPAFAMDQGGTLTTEHVKILAEGLRTHWGKSDGGKTNWPPYLLSEVKGDSDRGLAVFARACAKCHGPEGRGTGKAGTIKDAVFLDLASAQVLRRIIITGRPDLGMPNCAEGEGRPLSNNDIDDLLALLMYWKHK